MSAPLCVPPITGRISSGPEEAATPQQSQQVPEGWAGGFLEGTVPAGHAVPHGHALMVLSTAPVCPRPLLALPR